MRGLLPSARAFALLLGLLVSTGCATVSRGGGPVVRAAPHGPVEGGRRLQPADDDLDPSPSVVVTAHGVPVVRIGDPLGLRLAEQVASYLESTRGIVRKDCSGLIESAFRDLGIALPMGDVDGNAVARVHDAFRREGWFIERPLPGDLVFFDDTHDKNRNGKLDDPLTHIAMVRWVGLDGTVGLIHYGHKGVATLTMNLRSPHETRDGRGQRLNDHLRMKKRRDPAKTRYLAAELFAGYGRPPDALDTVDVARATR